MLIKLKILFSKLFFCEKVLWKQKMQLWRPRKTLVSRRLKIFWTKSDCHKKTKFLSKNFFSTLVPQTRNLRFWQPQRCFLGVRPKDSHSKSEKKKKLYCFSEKCFSSKCFFWNTETVLATLQKLFRNKLNFFARYTNKFCNLYFLQKEFFLLQNVSRTPRI